MWKNIVGEFATWQNRTRDGDCPTQKQISWYGSRTGTSTSGSTNCLQVGTHADSLVAEAVVKGIRDFDLETAFEAVLKDATVPPENDWNTS